MTRTGRSDPRYKSRHWKRVRLQVLNRDLWQCRIRLPNCLGTASQVDHIISPHPWLGNGDFYALDNLRAACKPCNNGLNNPETRARFFSEARTDDSPPANLSLQKRFGPVTSDYSRKAATDGDASS